MADTNEKLSGSGETPTKLTPTQLRRRIRIIFAAISLEVFIVSLSIGTVWLLKYLGVIDVTLAIQAKGIAITATAAVAAFLLFHWAFSQGLKAWLAVLGTMFLLIIVSIISFADFQGYKLPPGSDSYALHRELRDQQLQLDGQRRAMMDTERHVAEMSALLESRTRDLQAQQKSVAAQVAVQLEVLNLVRGQTIEPGMFNRLAQLTEYLSGLNTLHLYSESLLHPEQPAGQPNKDAQLARNMVSRLARMPSLASTLMDDYLNYHFPAAPEDRKVLVRQTTDALDNLKAIEGILRQIQSESKSSSYEANEISVAAGRMRSVLDDISSALKRYNEPVTQPATQP